MKTTFTITCLLLASSCSTVDGFRAGFASTNVDDDVGAASALGLEQLSGAELTVTGPLRGGDDPALAATKGFFLLNLSSEESEPFKAERQSIGFGIEPGIYLGENEDFRLFAQLGVMATDGTLSQPGASDIDGDGVGPMFGVGLEVMLSDSVGLFTLVRPIEPDIEYEGGTSATDSQLETLSFGISFSK